MRMGAGRSGWGRRVPLIFKLKDQENKNTKHKKIQKNLTDKYSALI